MAISAKTVMELREKTGLPMMECKKALEETNGDPVAAEELLRKKGHAQADKRAGKQTGEGRILIQAAGDKRVMVETLCETEPVSGTEDFVALGKVAMQVALTQDNPTSESILAAADPTAAGRTVQDRLLDVVNRIRENIKIGRVAVVKGHTGSYLHHDQKTGVLVEFNADCPPSLAADVCMHIAAMRPQCARREEVDPQLVEAERKIAAEQVQGKPANMVEKIVDGKLNRWYSEIVLLEQPFVKEEKKSVGQILKEASPNLTVNRYVRYHIGEV